MSITVGVAPQCSCGGGVLPLAPQCCCRFDARAQLPPLLEVFCAAEQQQTIPWLLRDTQPGCLFAPLPSNSFSQLLCLMIAVARDAVCNCHVSLCERREPRARDTA